MESSRAQKYKPQYFLPPSEGSKNNWYNWVTQDKLEKAPRWCNVDLRDGNQALINPLTLEEKLAYFDFLLDLGFKEIEVGFPAASETEYRFLRTLIEEDLIPDDVTIQVLTQSRAHIIERTFDSLKGAKQAIVHLYNSTSQVQREQVFRRSKAEIKEIAEVGARIFLEFAEKMPETKFTFEYSPESFTGTEPEFALEVCNAVIDIWQPTADCPVIINLPATVEVSMPHVHAAQIAYMNAHLHSREHVIISLHPHNDRGTGVAAAEMGLLAGADRVEGTLFGNGERTGNVDLITLALNLCSHGIDPGLNLWDMPHIVKTYEETMELSVPARHPYAGELVFAAFSGSHQDAIAKGMDWRKGEGKEDGFWTVPYLPLDPADVNRRYDADVIRINSQSGKGGVSYILEQNFGYKIPKAMMAHVGYLVKDISDKAQRELSPEEIFEAFESAFVNVQEPISLTKVDWQRKGEKTHAVAEFCIKGKTLSSAGEGNGSLDSLRAALEAACPDLSFSFVDYIQHALEDESDARAAAYVQIKDSEGKDIWGIGVDHDIAMASVYALISAINNMSREKS
jgi:2-isopropylmalate synthase